MRVFELAAWHGRGGLDNGPSKSAADATEQAVGTVMWTSKTWVKWLHHGGRTWVKWQPHESITGVLSKLLRSWRTWGRKCPLCPEK